MPTKTPVVRVQYDHGDGKGRRRYELTNAQIRALSIRDGDRDGRLSEAVPFATAESLVRQGLAVKRGPHWHITRKGRAVGKRARAKQAQQKA